MNISLLARASRCAPGRSPVVTPTLGPQEIYRGRREPSSESGGLSNPVRMEAEVRISMSVAVLLASVLQMPGAFAGDSPEGKKLHDLRCMGCHDTSVYARKDRQVKSLAALKEQLDDCSHAGQITLTAEEQKKIVDYLNKQFYKFQ